MSTPKWKKDLRQKQQAEAKRKREYDAMFTTSKTTAEFREYKPTTRYVRETRHVESLSTVKTAVCAPAPKREYTGDLIVGIATMHKSNAVPVMRGTSQAEDIAKMRRG